jgi:hypothetical protein
MVKKASSSMVKAPSSKPRSSIKRAPVADRLPPAIELASAPDEHRIRERAYGIWIEEGRPDGRDLAHWRRAREEIQRGAS